MRGNILIVDKKTEFNTFRYEERIKSPQFQEGIDYTFDGNIYFILSPQLKKDILLIQNPYHDNIDVSDILSMKVLVDYQDGINVKPKIVTDLEQREGLIEVGRGINNFTRSLPPNSEVQAIEDSKVNFAQIQEITDEEAEKIKSENFLNQKVVISANEEVSQKKSSDGK